MGKFPENFNFNPDKKLTKEENFELETKLTELTELTEEEIELLKKLINAIQLYRGSEDIKNPTEVLEPEIQPGIVTEIRRVGNPMVEVSVSKYAQPVMRFFREKLVPEVNNVKEEEQWIKAIEKALEEMKDYLEKVGIGMDKKEELANLILSLVKQREQE
jgi:hypothetical protein